MNTKRSGDSIRVCEIGVSQTNCFLPVTRVSLQPFPLEHGIDMKDHDNFEGVTSQINKHLLCVNLQRKHNTMNTTYLLNTLLLVAVTAIFLTFVLKRLITRVQKRLIPVSVNYHFTRVCNYSCGFCFHTALTSHVYDLDTAKKGMRLLKEAGMRKINFAGGEPFLPKYAMTFLGPLVQYCKEIGIESVSIVSNGSHIKQDWFERYGEYLDVLAISCDSFIEETNVKIGRGTGKHIPNLYRAKDYCDQYNIKFKINTVVNRYNFNEDMNQYIEKLQPFRWKCFQVLVLEGENSGDSALRNAAEFKISTPEFNHFLHVHKSQKSLVPESNEAMKNSYLILDEYLRFLNCTDDKKEPTDSILTHGVQKALEQSGWDPAMFQKRGGVYDWNKDPPAPTAASSCKPVPKDLEW